MKKYYKLIFSILIVALTWAGAGCSKNSPIDEDGLLITERAECYVSSFELLGSDHVTVRSKAIVIDTTAAIGTINVEVLFGTDLKNVYPQFSLVTDAKLEPKITGRVDLSDLANPKTYTVISGNRKVKRAYQVIIKFQ